MKYFAGIDPGKKGAIVLLNEQGEIESIKNLGDTEHDIETAIKSTYEVTILTSSKVIFAVEKCQYTPKMGAKSAFTFGKNIGLIDGILLSLGIKRVYISPQVWKKEFSLIRRKFEAEGTAKKRSKDIAFQLWPKWRKQIRRVDHAEAALIAEFARRRNL